MVGIDGYTSIKVYPGFLVNDGAGRILTAADGVVLVPEALADQWIRSGWVAEDRSGTVPKSSAGRASRAKRTKDSPA